MQCISQLYINQVNRQSQSKQNNKQIDDTNDDLGYSKSQSWRIISKIK